MRQDQDLQTWRVVGEMQRARSAHTEGVQKRQSQVLYVIINFLYVECSHKSAFITTGITSLDAANDGRPESYRNSSANCDISKLKTLRKRH